MVCLRCEERARLTREMWEAARKSDYATFHAKARALMQSAKDDVKSLITPTDLSKNNEKDQ